MSDAMTHENEYHDSMVKMLELIWGQGYMAPGGAGNVAKILEETEPRGKRILDVGCGIGGPAFEMAQTFGATVVGIDIEAPLIARATAAAKAQGLQDQCSFETVEPGPLPFSDQSFDIVISSGAITQTIDKSSLLGDCHRVLVPGGYLSCYEWMKSERDYSDEMRYWFKLEGLTYVLETLDHLCDHFHAAGFVDVNTADASAWYRAEARREHKLIKGPLYNDLVRLLGRQEADHFVESWRVMVALCDSGELRQGYCRGRRFNTVRAA
jgi:phosphoethanolamine N-methyltransferase